MKLFKSTVPGCLRSSVMLLSDEEEEAYALCPLLAERKGVCYDAITLGVDL